MINSSAKSNEMISKDFLLSKMKNLFDTKRVLEKSYFNRTRVENYKGLVKVRNYQTQNGLVIGDDGEFPVIFARPIPNEILSVNKPVIMFDYIVFKNAIICLDFVLESEMFVEEEMKDLGQKISLLFKVIDIS